MKPDKVRIDRATWAAGSHVERGYLSELLNRAGQMCCLGFLAEACGVPRPSLLGTPMPGNLVVHRELLPSVLFERGYTSTTGNASSWEFALATINDIGNGDASFTDIDDATREAWIAEGFRTLLGIEVEFFNDYPAEAP